MNQIYLRPFGLLTVVKKTDKGLVFKEIPNKLFYNDFIQKNIVEKNEYVNIEITPEDFKRSVIHRDIEYLYHFTSVNNLISILKKGFLPRVFLYDKNRTNNFKKDFINARFYPDLNDPNRFDGLINCTSFSISRINEHLLAEYKKRYPTRKYCILKVRKELLIDMYSKKSEYFFYHNAASYPFREKKYNFKKGQAFNKMFYDNLLIQTSTNSLMFTRNFDAQYTTSNQAEVMIDGILNSNNILEIIFFEKSDLDYVLSANNISENIRSKIINLSKIDLNPFN